MLKFHGLLNNLSTKDAKRDIEEKIGISKGDRSAYEKRLTEIRERQKNIKPEIELPLKERHRAYRKMLSLTTLETDHFEDLIHRGLSNEFIQERGYRSIPCDEESRLLLTRKMLADGYSVKNLPGFYLNNHQDYCMKKFTRSIMIPVRSVNGLIQGFQLRKDNDKLLYKHHKDRRTGDFVKDENGNPKLFPENKFNCFSTPNELNGGKMKSVCHFAGDFEWNSMQHRFEPVLHKNSIKFTEGPLKGDIFFHLTGEPIICIQGVNNTSFLKQMILQLKVYYPNLDTIENCLDMDFIENEHVLKAEKKIENMIHSMGLTYVRRMWNPKFKGIDDFALAYKQGLYESWTRP